MENEPTVTAMETGMIVAGKEVCREKRFKKMNNFEKSRLFDMIRMKELFG